MTNPQQLRCSRSTLESAGMSKAFSEAPYEASIRASIKTRWLGWPLHFYAALPSTNDLLVEMAAQNAPAGSMVVTDFQSQGKGRLGRSWQAPAGTSLLFSLLFRPEWPPERSAW